MTGPRGTTPREIGRYSRRKGSSEERGLVQHLNRLGYANVRKVPLSGAAAGFPFDVYCDNRDTTRLSFEVKYRSSDFNWIYKHVGFFVPVFRYTEGGRCIAIGDTPDLVLQTGPDTYFSPSEPKFFNKLFKLSAYLNGADLLVIRGPNRRRLFIKYWL